jgi:hypothetical protein
MAPNHHSARETWHQIDSFGEALTDLDPKRTAMTGVR